jgi:pimeloyl-ACP methyl ester carboxylesterase
MKNCDRQYFFGKKGERLLIQEWGPLDKPVVLLVHGFPGCAEHAKLMSGTPYWNSFRLIAMDRPGYGQSDVQKKITPLKFAQQIKDLLDEKEIHQVYIISVSGGAPFSLALAYLLKDRVRKLISVGGIAPLTLKTFNFLNTQQKKTWFLRNFVPEPILKLALNRVWQKGMDKIDEFLFTDMDSFSPYDRKVLEDPNLGPMLVETTKAALSQGAGGVLGDLKVYSKSWGFPLNNVDCPITLWHGREDDIVNYMFAEDMKKRLPQAQLHFVPQQGHYSLLVNCRDVIIGDLLGDRQFSS